MCQREWRAGCKQYLCAKCYWIFQQIIEQSTALVWEYIDCLEKSPQPNWSFGYLFAMILEKYKIAHSISTFIYIREANYLLEFMELHINFKNWSFLYISSSKTFCPLTSTATEEADGWCENLNWSDSKTLPVKYIFVSRRKNRKCQTIPKSNYKHVS